MRRFFCILAAPTADETLNKILHGAMLGHHMRTPMNIDLFADLPPPAPPMIPALMDLPELVARIKELGDLYRIGKPAVSDHEYDHVWLAALREKDPTNPLLLEPEPEPEHGIPGARVPLPAAMLSTDKAYTSSEVEAWATRVTAAAADLGIADVMIQVQPKLDGIAAYDTGTMVCTRGRHGYGTDITHLFTNATPIKTSGGRGRGAGEIVISKSYFDEVLRPTFGLDHPRNYIAGFVAAETVRDYHTRALADGEIVLLTYADLPTLLVPLAEFVSSWESLMDQVVGEVPYLCDGAVASVVSEELRAAMGATSHHHRWQIATKRNDEAATATVRGIRMTTGVHGRITPTVELEPITLYGVKISWVTAHTAQHLSDLQLGPGAVIRVERGGGVIPRIAGVVQPAAAIGVDLDHCPACGADTERDGAYLVCPDVSGCGAQTARRLMHFFKTIAVCNGFGESVTEALAAAGVKTPLAVYGMDQAAFVAAGISPGVAANLVAELARSRVEPIADAILLGALAHRHLGRGDSRRLLAEHPLETLGTLTAEQIERVAGFGAHTSALIAASLQARKHELEALLALGFNLVRTPLTTAAPTGPLTGITLVFTGSMTTGTRDAMEAEARTLGGTVGSSVTKKTSWLVCGSGVGATKTGKAAALGVEVIDEAEYRRRIGA